MPSSALDNFAGGFYQAICPVFAADTAVNLYTESRDIPGSAKQVAMIMRPGLKLWGTVTPQGERGFFTQDGRTWTVIGDALYELDVPGQGFLYRGVIANDGLPVSFACNGRGGEQLGIQGGGQIKVLDLQTNVLSAAIALPFSGPVQLAFIDGYTLCLEAHSPIVWFSALEDMESWDALDFFARSGTSDNLVGITVSRDRIWCIGSKTTTLFYDSGNADTPFLPYPGTTAQVGGLSPYLIGVYNDIVYWVGASAKGERKVYRASDPSPVPISTPPIELWLQAGRLDTAELFIYEQEGHPFVTVTAPDITAPQYRGICTFTYDVKENLWAERAGWNSTTGRYVRWRARGCTAADGVVLVGDYENGNLYELDLNTHTDNGAIIKTERTFPYLSNENQWLFLDQLEIGIQAGMASSAAESPITPCVSPLILDLDPDSVDVGDTVTITGTGFGDVQGTGVVTIGALEMAVEAWSDTAVVVTVPVGAASDDVIVITHCGPSNPVPLTLNGCVVPTLTLIDPDTGDVGDPVVLTGTDFGASQGSSTVTVNGIEATIVSWADTEIDITVPVGAATGSVIVTTPCGVSNSLQFTVPVPAYNDSGNLVFLGYGDFPMLFYTPDGVDAGAPGAGARSADGSIGFLSNGNSLSRTSGTIGTMLDADVYTILGSLTPTYYAVRGGGNTNRTDRFYGFRTYFSATWRTEMYTYDETPSLLQTDLLFTAASSKNYDYATINGATVYYSVGAPSLAVSVNKIVLPSTITTFIASGPTGKHVNNLILLSTGQLLVSWHGSTPSSIDYVYRYNTNGTVAQIYTIDTLEQIFNGTDDTTFWLIRYDYTLTTFSQIVVENIDVATGTVLHSFIPEDGEFDFSGFMAVIP